MKKLIVMVVAINALFVIIYGLGAFRGEAAPPLGQAAAPERVSPPRIDGSEASATQTGANEIVRTEQTSSIDRTSVSQDGKEVVPREHDPKEVIDPKEIVDPKEALEPIGELIESRNPGLRPLLPNTEFLGLSEGERRGVLAPADPRTLAPPVVSPER